MVLRNAQTDPYGLLQVPPHASLDEITAAYERLQALYSTERLQGGPPEFEELARQKRADLDAAYAVLSDPMQRATYDRQHGHVVAETAVLDYRPLPPARGQERPSPMVSDVEPARVDRALRRAGARGWVPGALVALSGLAFLLLLIFSNVRADGNQQALATPTIANIRLPFAQNQIEQFRAAAETSDTAQTWAALGNALFDNLQTLRENAPQSPQYQGLREQWLEAAQAYERSLALEENETVRSDYALALLSYGIDADDQDRRQQAIAEADRATQRGVEDPRALINYGLVLAQGDASRVGEAAALWRRATEIAPGSPEATRARALLQNYGQADDT
jgi:curved DNA-binding protein CbpA